MNTPAPTSVTIAKLPPTTRIVLRTADPASTGLALPLQIGTRSVDGAQSALCLGPDEWLLETKEAERTALRAAVAAIATPHSAVEVSDREVTYVLEGPGVLDLLATGCPRDLARMPTGSGARTIFDSVQVVLTREAEYRFHLTVWRSFAPHVGALLDIAARELVAGL